jgi:YihY family inner membrane protein
LRSRIARRDRTMGVIKRVQAFWAKFSNDWCMNLAGLLAYNFLTAIFPLLLGILALAALIAPPAIIDRLATTLNAALPPALTGQAHINFATILTNFRHASGLTALVSLVGLLWTGANLFGCMENCFSIIFRTRDRSIVKQKLMALVMIVLFAILAPLSVFAATISGSFNALAGAAGAIPGLGLLVAVGGYLLGVLFAFLLFETIYLVVPNLRIEWKDTWRGALLAAVLFELVNLVFPLYVKTQHGQFGQFALLLAILTFWFWVLSLILLLGAELNSFAALGQRALGGDLPTMLHEVQVHGRAPRQGEDADAPPPGHPPSAEGERRHAATQNEPAATSEGVAHPPEDRDRPAPGADGRVWR